MYKRQGKALSIVRGNKEVNGYESWRRVVAEYEPQAAARKMTLLATLLAPPFAEATFREQFLDWERRLLEYELIQGGALAEDVKCAVVLRYAPKRYKQYLQVCAYSVADSFVQLKQALKTYWDRGRVNDVGEQQPMEVDALTTRGRGRGQGAGRGRGLGPCFTCGEMGLSLIHI